MLTREQIRKMAGYSYARGAELYNRGKVISYHAEKVEACDRIEARVRGSVGKLYDVMVLVDPDLNTVLESYCDCPAFYSYDGLCKHCVAVLLRYVEEHKQAGARIAAAASAEGQRPGQRLSESRQKEAGRTRRTTAQMKVLLQKEAIRQTLPLLQGQTCGKVRLEPNLVCTTGACNVEFRIGIEKMYVLRDVFAFARAMQEKADYAYGKNLQFIHTPESFTASAQKLAEFILEWVSRYGKQYMQYDGYGFSYRQTQARMRYLPLDSGGMDAFLDAVGKCSFPANIGGSGESLWTVTEEELRRKVKISGKQDGMEVMLDPLFGYECERDFVYFKEQRIYRIPKERMAALYDFMECMRELPNRTAFVHREDMPAFFRQILPVLQEHCDCSIEGIDGALWEVAPVSFRFYLDMPQKELITCRGVALYGEKAYSIYDRTQDVEQRDLWKEAEAAGVLNGYCNAYEEELQRMVTSQEELAYALLTEGVGRLQQIGEVFVSDALKRVKVMQPPQVSVGISLSGDLLNLELASEDLSREQLAEILSRYDRKRKFYKLKDGSFVRMEEEGMNALDALQDVRKVLQLTDRQLAAKQVKVPAYRALYLEEALDTGSHLTVQKDEPFQKLIRRMKTVEENDFVVPASLRDIMREYQKDGFRWIKTLYHNGFGGILADDMGLGKTLQVIAFLLSEQETGQTGIDGQPGKQRRPSLIVCPASLVYNWKRELERFAPGLLARTVTGTAAERAEILAAVTAGEILITSYDLLRRDLEQYGKMSFFCQVVDEAQYIKNHGTQAAKAVKAVNAAFRLALTGTPVENRLSELWSIFDYLMPGYLYSYTRFREELELPIVQRDEERAAVRLQKMIAPFVLRRLKQEVLKELPDKLEENLYVELEGEQKELYEAHVKRMQLMLHEKSDEEFNSEKLQILAELTKLRQLCCDPALLYENYKGESVKREMVVNLIRSAVENGHKVLLFSQFTTMLERLAQALRREDIACHMLVGATPKEKRAEMVEAFETDDVPVFCISLRAGGTGLNLTAADVVIHFDPWWNVAVQNQATDRAHRIGQTNTVNVFRLIAKGSIEEKIMELQERKMELADRILGGEGMGSVALTREELLELLQD